MSSVLLSHSSRDKAFVRRLRGDLEREGIVVWLDEVELRVGDDLAAIEEAIGKSQYLVVVKSAAAMASPWVRHEVRRAQEVRLPVLPVVLEEIPDQGDGFLADLAIADFRAGYRRALWRLIGAVTDRPNPLLTAKAAAERVKREMPVVGELFGLSQQGVGTCYSLTERADWVFADATEGLSRLWIVELYDRRRRSVHPFAVVDQQIHELPVLYALDSDREPVADSVIVKSCVLNPAELSQTPEALPEGRQLAKRYTPFRPVPIVRDFVNSDVAVASAVASPQARRQLGERIDQLFTLTKLEADKVHGNAVLWKVSFFDSSLSESVLTVGVNAVTGDVKYPAMLCEDLNVNSFLLHGKGDTIHVFLGNQLKSIDRRTSNTNTAPPGTTLSTRPTAADALRLASVLLGDDRGSWQLAFLSNTGVVKTTVRSPVAPVDRLLRVDGTAGQWVVELCGKTATPVTEGTRSGFKYDFLQIVVTPEEGAVIAEPVSKVVFTVPMSQCPVPSQLLDAYEDARDLALRAIGIDFEAMSVAHSRPPSGLQWCFRFYDAEEIVGTIWVSGDGSRVVN